LVQIPSGWGDCRQKHPVGSAFWLDGSHCREEDIAGADRGSGQIFLTLRQLMVARAADLALGPIGL